MEKIQRWQKVSSNQRESEILSEINMARRLRSDNRIVRKEIEGYKSFAEGKGQIIELLRKEAEDSAAQLETLKTRCEELETECQELRRHRLELWLVGIIEKWQKRKMRRDIRRLNRMINEKGGYTEVQQIFLIDLLKSGITFKEIKKTSRLLT